MQHIVTRVAVVALTCVAAGCAAEPIEASAPDAPLREGWASNDAFYDGKAEVNTYDARIEREGAFRRTRAYTVLVTEDLDPESLVKADDWRRPGLVKVFKHGLIFSVQTGMSEFREAFNIFFDAGAWRPLKLVYSSQDWCGLTFQTWIDREDRAPLHRYTSYWEDDGGHGERRVEDADGAIPADALPTWVRSLDLEPGDTLDFRVVPSFQGSKVGTPRSVPAELRVGRPHRIDVPAGDYEVLPVTASFADVSIVIQVERAFPNRVISWEDAAGQTFRLVQSRRSAYWEKVDDGDERLLRP